MAGRTTLGILGVVLVAVALIIIVGADDSSAAVDDTFSANGLNYTVTAEGGSNTVKVTGFTDETIADLVIPNTVTHSATVYTVNEIGASAFATKGIRTVNLGDVTNVDTLAFSGCVLLTEVRGDDVASIGISSFSGCVTLTSFTGGSITNVGASAFTGCVLLNSIDLSHADTIGMAAFMECKMLKTVNLSGANLVGGYAFYDSGLTGVSIPLGLIDIGGAAFNKCSNLTSISISSLHPVYKIDNGALVGRLTNTLKVMPSAYNIPDGNYVISDSIDEIDDGAFDGCDKLRSITIPSSVETIGVGAFRNCPNLSSVTVSGGNHFKTVNNCLYSYDGTSIILVPETYSGQFVIPAGVTTIEPYCFSDCSSITSVDLTNVTDIGRYAFSDCFAMTVMHVDKDATIGVMAFDLGSINHSVTCAVRSNGVDFIGIEERNAYTTIVYHLPITFELQDAPAGVPTPEKAWAAKNGSLDLAPYKTSLARYGFTTYVDGVLFEENSVPIANLPRTVSFHFDGSMKYILSFNTNGGSQIAPIMLDSGEAIPEILDPVRMGHTFVSWTPAIPAVMPSNDLVVSSTWSNVVPKEDIITDGDTKKIITDDIEAELVREVIDKMREGSNNVQMDVNEISIKMDVTAFDKLTGTTGGITVNAEKSTGLKNSKVLEKLSASKKSIAEKAVILDISFTTSGSTSGLGIVTITVPYTLALGQSADKIVVYFVSDNGDLEEMMSHYSNGKLTVESSHFSTFAVCSESLTGSDDDGSPSSGGMNLGLIIGGAVGAIVVIGVIVFIIKKH